MPPRIERSNKEMKMSRRHATAADARKFEEFLSTHNPELLTLLEGVAEGLVRNGVDRTQFLPSDSSTPVEDAPNSQGPNV